VGPVATQATADFTSCNIIEITVMFLQPDAARTGHAVLAVAGILTTSSGSQQAGRPVSVVALVKTEHLGRVAGMVDG